MANKAISELPQALNVNNQDLFVLEQSGIAKKLTAETFITEQGIIDALAEALDGHGGISSVTLSSVSGRIRTYLITFTDETTTTFQVLDGTSISRIEKTSTAGLVDTYTVFMTDGTTSFFQVRNGQDGSATWDQINSKAPIITDTVTGVIANFPDGADDIPVADLVVNIEPKQSGSGDPSPSNIRPITGWTGANVTRTGKNLLSVQPTLQTNQAQLIADLGRNTTGQTFTITFDFDNADYQTASAALIDFKEEDGTHHYLTPYNFYNEHNTNIPNAVKPVSGRYSYTGSYAFRYVYSYFMSSSYGYWTGTINNAQLEFGSSATAYEAPQVQTVTVDWTTEAGTVYGGTLDVTTGVLTVDRVREDLSTYDWNKQSENDADRLRSRVTNYTSEVAGWDGDWHKTKSNCFVSESPFLSFATRSLYSFSNIRQDYYNFDMKVPTGAFADAAAYKSWLANIDGNGTHAVVVIQLAAPQTYQLTPQEVRTLLGTNYIFSDCSSIEVEYRADTEIYIEKDQLRQDNNLAYVESSSSASRAYAVDDFFVNRDGLLCKVTATVSSGGTLVEGTNYTVLSGNGGLGAEVTSCEVAINGKEDVGWLTGMGFSRTDVSGGGNVTIRDYTIFLAKLITVSGANIQSLVNAHYKVTFYLRNSNGGSFSLSGNCAGNTYNLASDSSGLVSGTYEGDVSANGTIYNGLVGGSVGSGSIFAATVLVKF